MIANISFLIPCKISLNNKDLFIFADIANKIYYNSDYTINDSQEIVELFESNVVSNFNFFTPSEDVLMDAMKMKDEHIRDKDSFFKEGL